MTPGDLVFCHSKGVVAWGIRLAQRLAREPDWQINHCAVLDNDGPGTPWRVIQAEAHGVTNFRKLSEVAPGGTYEVVPLPQSVDRDTLLAFARQEVGARYGFLTIASIVLTLLSPRFLDIRTHGSWICSALAGESLRAGGWVRHWPDVYQVTPAQLRAEVS